MERIRFWVGVVQIVIAAISTAIAVGLLPAHPEILALLLAIQNTLQGTRHMNKGHPTNGQEAPPPSN